MKLALAKRQFLINSLPLLSEIFHISEEGAFLSEYLSTKEINSCLQTGASNLDHLMHLTSHICFTNNNALYLGLLNRLIILHRTSRNVICNMLETCTMDDNVQMDVQNYDDLQDFVSRNQLVGNSKSRMDSQIEKENEKLKKQLIEMQQQVTKLQEENNKKQKISINLPKYTSFIPPNDMNKKINYLENYEFQGLKCIRCNSIGIYEIVNWNNLTSQIDWKKEWMKMKTGATGWLVIPPLILPEELGNWVILLTIQWDKDEILLLGWIDGECKHNKQCPNQITMELHFTLTIEKICKFQIQKIVTIRKDDDQQPWKTYKLFEIKGDFKKQQMLPVAEIKVKKV